MTVRRYLGIETEYGILTPTNPRIDPILASSMLVHAYNSTVAPGPRWDYSDEDPLADARGFRLDRQCADQSQLTDEVAADLPATAGSGVPKMVPVARSSERSMHLAAGSTVIANGGRLYVDHAHPEYSSPEVLGPLAGVQWDRAGELIMARACAASATPLPRIAEVTPLAAYKNNVDGKGASYGTHENFLLERAVEFGDLVDLLTPFLVTRAVLVGAGRVGIGPGSEQSGFQIHARADYIESQVALETTFNRPIVNSRDEPHADREAWRRLHLIIGDANCFDVSTYMKLGTTSLVLWLAEQARRVSAAKRAVTQLRSLRLANPVMALKIISRDLDLNCLVPLADGRMMSALDIQRCYHDQLAALLPAPDPDTADVLQRWHHLIEMLTNDRDAVASEVEWVGKHQLFDAKRVRDGVGWSHPRLGAMDVQWSDVREGKSLVKALAARGGVTRLVSAADVALAVDCAPQDTRAWLRAALVRRHGRYVERASWDAVVLDVPGQPHAYRIGLGNPGDGTRDATANLVNLSVTDMIAQLAVD